MTEQETQEFESLLELLKKGRNFDFTGYKRTTLVRRVRRRMTDVGVQSFADYAYRLESEPGEFPQLFNTILINVTSFFRDPEAWETLRRIVLEPLAQSGQPLRVWSAGCASGEETYTLLMLLAELMGADAFKNLVKVYATDADENALEQARLATYTSKAIENVPPDLLNKYFVSNKGRWAFINDLRRCVIFGNHDLVADAPISRLDLLVCRNTLIYFNSETQRRILGRFHFALNPDGYLFLGKSEMLVTQWQLFTPADVASRIFRKVPAADLRERLLVAPPRKHDGTPEVVRRDLRTDQAHMHEVVFEAAPVAQIILDRMSNVILVNQQARSVFNIKPEDIGRPIQDLQVSYRPLEIRSRIDEAIESRSRVAVHGVDHVTSFGDPTFYDVQVEPLLDVDNELIGINITYVDVTAAHKLRLEVERSQHELETAYEEMQATNEELETTNEELQSSVEEMDTTNEELQSTNEELETMNEELHSTNDELATMNEELRRRTTELNHVNDFIEAILTSLHGALIVTDDRLHIQVWNYKAEDLWGLRAEEVYGKLITDLDIGLPMGQLAEPLRRCMDGQEELGKVIVDAVNRRGKSIKVRISCNRLRMRIATGGGLLILMEEWHEGD